MEDNSKVNSVTNHAFGQRILFSLLSKISYGRISISDDTGIHVFEGSVHVDTHAVNVRINDRRVYSRILINGSLAAGETYFQGYWDVDDLTKLIEIIIKNTEIFSQIDGASSRMINLILRIAQAFKINDITRSKKNILAHYDLGNEFFMQFLDPSMMYSCALFEPANIGLAEASLNKIERICQKMRLQSSDHILEIGTGWGSFAFYAAQKYGCHVTTTTISDKQYAYVKQKIEHLGLKDKIELLNLDYRQLNGKYDKVVSIEMIEAIGYKYFDTFFRQCNALTKPNGLFFLQAILINDQAYDRARHEVDFIRKYIFPGGCLPSMGAIASSIAKHTQFQLINFNDIGPHYATTLHAWLNNFNEHITQIRQMNFSEEFIRMWRYYFCYCAAAFNQRYITDVHALWKKRA